MVCVHAQLGIALGEWSGGAQVANDAFSVAKNGNLEHTENASYAGRVALLGAELEFVRQSLLDRPLEQRR